MIFFNQPNKNKKFVSDLNKILKINRNLNYNIFQKNLKNLIKKNLNLKIFYLQIAVPLRLRFQP